MTHLEQMRLHNHDKVWELLPWYLNGSIDQVEKELVEQHSQVCIACRAELNAQRELSAYVNQADIDVLATRSSFRELARRIHADDPAQICLQPQRRRWLDDVFGWLNRGGLSGKFAMASIATVAMMLSAAYFGSDITATQPLDGQYRTLTAATQDSTHTGRVARVVFSDHVSVEQVRQTLSAIEASIVEGPSEQGVFLIRIGDSNTSLRNLVASISTLRADDNVIFAEPAFTLPLAAKAELK
jgi:anti-sigma factor RsiW